MTGRGLRAGPVRRHWRLLVAAGLLATLLIAVGPARLGDVVTGASPLHLSVAALLLVPWLLLGGLNVWLLLRSLAPIGPGAFAGAYVSAWSTSLLVPGQLGDATQVLLLRRHGVPAEASGAAYVVDKLVSVGWMALVASASIGVLFPQRRWLAWSAAALVAGGGVLARGIARRLAARRAPGGDAPGGGSRFLTQFDRLSGRTPLLALNGALTVAKWALVAFVYQEAFAAFGVALRWREAATLPVVASLVAYLPVSVGGAGTMEWTAVGLFGLVGVGATEVAAAYLFIRVTLYCFAGVAMAASAGRPRREDAESIRSSARSSP